MGLRTLPALKYIVTRREVRGDSRHASKESYGRSYQDITVSQERTRVAEEALDKLLFLTIVYFDDLE